MMPMAKPTIRAVRLVGGLDQITPLLSVRDGTARRAVNYEANLSGGYSRIAGYERFDGHTKPSTGVFIALTVSITGTLAVGDSINGQTSGATAKIIAISGSRVVVTRVVGTFTLTENIRTGVTVQGTFSDYDGTTTAAEEAEYLNLTADDYRADISAITGSGDVRGLCWYSGALYAWRNNAGGTAKDMWVSSGSGWTQVTLYNEVSFTAGSVSPVEGNTITQGANSATVKRIVVQSGTWGAGTAAGRLIVTTPAPGNFAAGALTAGGTLTLSGAQTAITIAAGGRVEAVVGNVQGGQANKRMYGCDGVGHGFEFDGTVYVPIVTGMSPDTPSHVAIHKSHLWFSFGYSAQFSSIADPYQWSPVTGAGEIVMNDTITNLQVMTGSDSSAALALFTRTDSSVIYGTSSANFAKQDFITGIGARAYTAQMMEQVYTFDDRGLQGFRQAQEFGNFNASSSTLNLRPFIEDRRSASACSTLARGKNQYRVLFSDGYGLYSTVVNGNYLGSFPVSFPNAATCACEGENSNGSQAMFFGSTNGMVYQLDMGSSFDGAAIDHYLMLAFNHLGSPRLNKSFRRAVLEISGEGYVEFSVGCQIGYGTSSIIEPAETSSSVDLREAVWDEMTWDNFYWDSAGSPPPVVSMDGTAENVALEIFGSSDEHLSFTINSVIFHYIPRRMLRSA